MALPRGRRRGPLRWGRRLFLYTLPYLLVVIALAGWLVHDRPLAYYAVALGVAVLGVGRALQRLRADLIEAVPDAPADAALLLGGPGPWRREVGLAWIDGDDLRFAGERHRIAIARGEAPAVRYRPWSRELTVASAAATLHLGALVDLAELPRLASATRRWAR